MMLKSAVICLSLGVTDAVQLVVDSDASVREVALHAQKVGDVNRDGSVNVKVKKTRNKRRNGTPDGPPSGLKEYCVNNGKKRMITLDEELAKWFRRASAGDEVEDAISCRYRSGDTQEERLRRYPDFDEYCTCGNLIPEGEAACDGKQKHDACTLTTKIEAFDLEWKSICMPGEDGGALRCAPHTLDTAGSCESAKSLNDADGNYIRRIKVWQPVGDRCVPSEKGSGGTHFGERRIALSYCVAQEGDLGVAGRTVCKRGYFPEIGEDGKSSTDYVPPEDASAVATYENCERFGNRKGVAIGSLEGCVEKAKEIGLVVEKSKESKWPAFPFGCLIETTKDDKTVLRFNSAGWKTKEVRTCGSKSNGGTLIRCLCGER